MRSRGLFTVAAVCLLAMGCTSLCGKGGGGAAPGGGAGAGATGPAVPLVLKDCFTDSTGAPIVPTSSFTGVYGPEGVGVNTTGTLTYADGDQITFVHGGTVKADDPVTGRSYKGTLTLKPGTN